MTLMFIGTALRGRSGELADGAVEIGKELDDDAGSDATRIAALNVLAAARQHLGSLDRVTRVVRLGVFLAASGDLVDQPKVADAASDLFRDVFGIEKASVRIIMGVASLPLGDLAILEEDKRYLEMRVARLDTGMAWAEDPPSRTRHLIGNLEAAPLENGEARARTAFLVYRSHLETDHQLLSGCRDDVLRKLNGAWKVARRTILLDANVLLDKNVSVFL